MRSNLFRVSIRYFLFPLATAFLLMSGAAAAQVRSVVESRSLLGGKESEVSRPVMGEVSGGNANGPANIQNNESRIGPDDLLDISVFEAPEMNRTVRVLANGDISLDLLGAVKAAGLTPAELESVLRERLKKTYMKDPHVSVLLRELQSHPVSVVGAVKKPGVFQIQGTKTVLEMLSMAEGPADDAGDKVLIMRGAEFADPDRPSLSRRPAASLLTNGKRLELIGFDNPPAHSSAGKIEQVNLKELMESDDSALNVPVYPGDIIKVTSAGIVYVVGEVHKPGGFVLKNNQPVSLLQAVALAQGLTHTSAASQARIVRTDPETERPIEIPVNLGKILSSKAPDPGLRPDDILFIPNSSMKSAFYRAAEAAVSTASGVAIYKW